MHPYPIHQTGSLRLPARIYDQGTAQLAFLRAVFVYSMQISSTTIPGSNR